MYGTSINWLPCTLEKSLQEQGWYLRKKRFLRRFNRSRYLSSYKATDNLNTNFSSVFSAIGTTFFWLLMLSRRSASLMYLTSSEPTAIFLKYSPKTLSLSSLFADGFASVFTIPYTLSPNPSFNRTSSEALFLPALFSELPFSTFILKVSWRIAAQIRSISYS